MLLARRFNRQMNRKKIARIKKKFSLITKIRRKNKYLAFRTRREQHRACANILARKFRVDLPDRVYSTDITELRFGNQSQKAYLAVFKDLATNEVVASEISCTASVELVTCALGKALARLTKLQKENLMIHSDQGVQFTHLIYRTILADENITQSMSRRGNCLDNAPVESFFSHLKDHLSEANKMPTLEKLRAYVTSEIGYYNIERPQLRLNKMPPVEYRKHLESKLAFN
jgi:putative transposase